MAFPTPAGLEQTVRAEQHPVAVPEGQSLSFASLFLAQILFVIQSQVHHDLGFIADRTHQFIAAEAAPGLFEGQFTLAYHLVPPGVVPGQLAEMPAAQQVHAAVSNVRNKQPAFMHRGYDHGGTHILFMELSLCFQVDLGIGHFHGILKDQGKVCFRGALHAIEDLVNGHLGRAFTGVLPADAVRNDCQVHYQPARSGDATGLKAVFIEAPL